MSSDLWFCLDCTSIVELNKHGYCSVCGSNAVDIASRDKALLRAKQTEIEQLEALWRKS